MIGFTRDDICNLRCPISGGGLEWRGHELKDGTLHYGALISELGQTWRIDGRIPNLADRSLLTPKDRVMDLVYDVLSPVHDLSVNHFLPILQYPDSDASRENYIKAMGLHEFKDSTDTIRVLEIGVGTGANIPLILHAADYPENLEIWAVDLNANMVQRTAQSYQHSDSLRLRLALADAHQLPFADSFFDRVLHVGGINIYRDVSQGLAEMARVAKADTPIVVVDEGLDKCRDNDLRHKLAFLWLTSMDEIREAPTGLIPDDCELDDVYNVSRFYYCMVYHRLGGSRCQ